MINNEMNKSIIYTDFHEASQVSQEQLDRWKEQVIRELEKGNEFASIRSGNGLVIGRKYEDKIRIYVISKGYECYEY